MNTVNGKTYFDTRVDTERVVVLGLGNGVGSRVTEEFYYETGRKMKFKGTLYRVLTSQEPEKEFRDEEEVVQIPNPAYAKWVADRRTAAQVASMARIIAYQQQQASNGLGSFQVELGRRYLRGEGVATNLTLAAHWLRSACTNGESQATNLLLQLPARP